MLNLIHLFDSLEAPPSSAENYFSAVPIIGYEQHRLGKDAKGKPLVLISTVAEPTNQTWPAPVVLEHLKVIHHVECRIIRPDGTTESGKFTLIKCRSHDYYLHHYFLRVLSNVILFLKNTPSQQEITQAINKLIELFRAITKLPQKSVQGLWGELFLIAQSRKPIVLVDAWHTHPEERYDFASLNQRIEVKSVGGRLRQHHFSLEQLNPPVGTDVLVASMFVERSQGGKSIIDLYEKIRSRIRRQPNLLLHLEQVIASTLGSSWPTSEERFDYKLAKQSLHFFEVAIIPSISPDLPVGVSNVRFKSDLTGIPPIDLASYREKGRLFGAI